MKRLIGLTLAAVLMVAMGPGAAPAWQSSGWSPGYAAPPRVVDPGFQQRSVFPGPTLGERQWAAWGALGAYDYYYRHYPPPGHPHHRGWVWVPAYWHWTGYQWVAIPGQWTREH